MEKSVFKMLASYTIIFKAMTTMVLKHKVSNEENLKLVTLNSANFENHNKSMSANQLQPDIWVDAYADYLFNYAVGRVSDVEIAKDLVQETFLAGLKSAKNYKGDATERTWLVAILKRKVIDYYRKINSKKGKAEVRMNYSSQTDSEGDWLEEQVSDPNSSYENDAIENEELGLAIQACIGKLPKKQALVFKMKTIQNISTEDICNDLDINPSNLWVMIHRARTALMGCLNENWF